MRIITLLFLLILLIAQPVSAQDRGIPIFKSIAKYTVLGGLGGAIVASIIWITDPLNPDVSLKNLSLTGMSIGFSAGAIYGMNNAYKAAFNRNDTFNTTQQPGNPSQPGKYNPQYPNGPYYPTKPAYPGDPNYVDPSLNPPDNYPYFDKDYKDLYENDKQYFNDITPSDIEKETPAIATASAIQYSSSMSLSREDNRLKDKKTPRFPLLMMNIKF